MIPHNADSRLNHSSYSKQIECSRAATLTLLAAAIIFGVLAGLALWKGSGPSLKNAPFPYQQLGFGAVAAGTAALTAAVILAAYNRASKTKEDASHETTPKNQTTPKVNATPAVELTPDLSRLQNEDIGSYLIRLQNHENWSLNQTTFKQIKQEEQLALIEYILHEADVEAPSEHQHELLKLIPPDLWPKERAFSDAYINAQIDIIYDEANDVYGNPKDYWESRRFTLPQNDKTFELAVSQYIEKHAQDFGNEKFKLVIGPWLLIDDQKYSDAFIRLYLESVDDLEDIPLDLLPRFVNYIITKGLNYIRYIQKAEHWEAVEHLTKEFLGGEFTKSVDITTRGEKFKRAMMQYLINSRKFEAINPSDLTSDYQYPDGFFTEYLKKINLFEYKKFRITEEQPREFITAITDLVIHLVEQSDRKLQKKVEDTDQAYLDEEYPLDLADYRKKVSTIVRMIPPSHLEDRQYSNSFMSAYLDTLKKYENFQNLNEGLRSKFTNYILDKEPQRAAFIDWSLLPEDASPSLIFIECALHIYDLQEEENSGRKEALTLYCKNNPTLPLVKALDNHYLEREPADIVTDFLNSEPTPTMIAQWIGYSRQKSASELMKRLNEEHILAIADAQQSHLVGNRLSKKLEFVLPEPFEILWRNNERAFAEWLSRPGRLQQQQLVNQFVDGLSKDGSSTLHTLEYGTMRLLGFEPDEADRRWRKISAKPNPYLLALEALPQDKKPEFYKDLPFPRNYRPKES